MTSCSDLPSFVNYPVTPPVEATHLLAESGHYQQAVIATTRPSKCAMKLSKNYPQRNGLLVPISVRRYLRVLQPLGYYKAKTNSWRDRLLNLKFIFHHLQFQTLFSSSTTLYITYISGTLLPQDSCSYWSKQVYSDVYYVY